VIRAGALLAVLALWGLLTYGNRALEVINPALLPTPSDVAAAGVAMVRDGSLFVNVGVSLLRIAQGFGLAAAAALALGILVGLCPALRLMLEPIVELLFPLRALIGPGHPGRELRRGRGRVRLGRSHRQ